jgi:DNA-binding MarR family transcriptional regulator
MEKLDDKVNHRPADVFESIHAIMHLFRSQQFRALRSGPDAVELSHMESKALAYFWRNPGATQRDLVLHSGRDKAQVTRLVTALRERGLLEARPDPLDRRSTRLYLSAEGGAAFEQAHRQGRQLAERALAGLSDAECEQLGSLLARVEARLRDEAPE